jgi:hypothetical protein
LKLWSFEQVLEHVGIRFGNELLDLDHGLSPDLAPDEAEHRAESVLLTMKIIART